MPWPKHNKLYLHLQHDLVVGDEIASHENVPLISRDQHNVFAIRIQPIILSVFRKKIIWICYDRFFVVTLEPHVLQFLLHVRYAVFSKHKVWVRRKLLMTHANVRSFHGVYPKVLRQQLSQLFLILDCIW